MRLIEILTFINKRKTRKRERKENEHDRINEQHAILSVKRE
jgi:hypothetical protein